MSTRSNPFQATSDDEIERESPKSPREVNPIPIHSEESEPEMDETVPYIDSSENEGNDRGKGVMESPPEPIEPNLTLGLTQTPRILARPLIPLLPRGCRIKRTARKQVPIPRATTSNPTPPALSRTARRLVDARKWNWIPNLLDIWRDEEGLVRVMERGESSTPSPIIPFTREPVERTIPPLLARVERHDRVLRGLAMHKKRKWENREDTKSRLEKVEKMATLNGREVSVMHETITEILDEVTGLRNQLEVRKRQIGGAEDYISLLETRVSILEENNAKNEKVTDALTRMIEALTQLKPPPK